MSQKIRFIFYLDAFSRLRISRALYKKGLGWVPSDRFTFSPSVFFSADQLGSGDYVPGKCITSGLIYDLLHLSYTYAIRSSSARSSGVPASWVTSHTSQRREPSHLQMGLRHGLNRQQRRALGDLVARERQSRVYDNAPRLALSSLAEFFNDVGASPDLFSVLPPGTMNGITLGECGHYVPASQGFRTRWGQVCQQCVEGGVYVRPVEDPETYYSLNILHNWGGEYHLEPEFAPDDDDDDASSSDSSGNRRDANKRLSYSASTMNFLRRYGSFLTTSQGPFHIGVELETKAKSASPSDIQAVVNAVRVNLNSSQAIVKYDGSVGERSCEIITAPAKYEDQVKWFSEMTLPRGTVAWDTEVCGLHIHVNSMAFNKLSLGKFLLFWNSLENAGFIRRVAGRHPSEDSQARDYAGRLANRYQLGGQSANPVHFIKSAKGDVSNYRNRYRIVNLTGLNLEESRRLGVDNPDYSNHYGKYNTVEVRVFRASLRKARLLAQVEFLAASVYFARDSSWSHMTEAGFMAYLKTVAPRFPNLARFLNVIGVNQHPDKEPVPVAEV